MKWNEPVLYQGTSLLVPLQPQNQSRALAPAQSLDGENPIFRASVNAIAGDRISATTTESHFPDSKEGP
jgi:hypothetical protein